MSKVVIRQHKSSIGEKDAQMKTLHSIGLKRPGNVVEREDSATLRGQLRKIAHLVTIEEDRRKANVAVETERRASRAISADPNAKKDTVWRRRKQGDDKPVGVES